MIAATTNELAGWACLMAGMVLSFLYSGVETGTYVVNKIRLDLHAEAGNRRARRLRAMLRDPGRPLVVVLIGNNLANYLASAGMVLVLTARGVAHTDWYSVAILTPLVFVFCELVPKNLFHRHGETLAYVFSGFLDLSRRLFTSVGLVFMVRGVIWLVFRLGGRRLTRSEGHLAGGERRIEDILAEGRASGALTHAQQVIAERVVNIRRVHLRDVMVPLEQAALVSESVTVEELRELLASSDHPRFGVHSGDRENVIGLLNAYDVLLDETGAPPSSHMTPPAKLPADLSVTEALVTLQRRRTVVGFVFSPDGRCLGLVSVKDLAEEIVGELEEW